MRYTTWAAWRSFLLFHEKRRSRTKLTTTTTMTSIEPSEGKCAKCTKHVKLPDAAAPTMLALWATEPLDKLNHHIQYADHSPNSLADFTAVDGPLQQVQERFFDMITNAPNCEALLLTITSRL